MIVCVYFAKRMLSPAAMCWYKSASYLVNIESTYIQTIVLTKYEAVLLFLLTVFRRFHGKWRETIIKNSEIF